MPQMSPMSWTSLSLMVSMTLLMTQTLSNSSVTTPPKSAKIKTIQSSKWSW